MRKRLVRAIIFIAVAVGVAVGAASAAGAIGLPGAEVSSDGISWGWGGSTTAGMTSELAAA
jgi:hypothetical protein